jgi:predicted dehydrogenase
MGRQHAAAWQKRDDCRVVSVFDPIEASRHKLAETVGATAYDSAVAAIEQPGVQVVSVCVPVAFHAEYACLAASRGRHVLSEKPLALSVEEADRMIRTAEENRVLLSTSFQYRGFSRNLKFRELVTEGAFGGPIFARYMDVREVRPKSAMHRKSMNGGPVVDMASHYFDLMRFFTDEEPVSVYAQGHVYGQGKPRLSVVDDFAIDAASIEVKFTGGHALSIFVNWGMPEGFQEITDELLIGPSMSARKVGAGLELQFGDRKEEWRGESDPPGPTVRIDGLVSAIRGEAPLEVTGDEGRVALRLSLAALESIATASSIQL